MSKDRVVGLTTTIPVEVLFAGGYIPCDLNNIFITAKDPLHYIELAEKDGFPSNMCNWVKGIYGVIIEHGIDTVITVIEGDCSNTRGLAEILQYKGIRTVPFSYPFDRDKEVLKRELDKLMREFAVERESLDMVFRDIQRVRAALHEIDRLTWQERLVTGEENHLWLVRASDMLGDYKRYNDMAIEFLSSTKTRERIEAINIGYIGVPPILIDLYEQIEEMGGHVVYNETQRQFAMPSKTQVIDDIYLEYTYPYGIFARLKDIKKEIKRRDVKGIIHYVQAFCYRAMEDVILRDALDIPMVTIEGDLPKGLDRRLRVRIEAFIEMLKEREWS